MLLATSLAACSPKEEAPAPQTRMAETAAPAVQQPFSPPADGLLTEDQVRRFLLSHRAMAEVNDLYLDSLAGASPAKQRALYQALDIARDKVTRKFGLDGYAEYRWILEDAPRRPENVRVLERMKVTTVTP